MHQSRILVALVCVIILSACFPGSNPDNNPDELAEDVLPLPSSVPVASEQSSSTTSVVTFGGEEFDRETFEPLIAAFNATNPDIRVQFVSLDDAYEMADTQLDPSAATRNIATAADTAIINIVTRDALQKGYVANLQPLINADAGFDRSDFYPPALASATIGDGVYILPRRLYLPLLAYNEDLWIARGVPLPTPEWTWEDVFSAAEQLAQVRGDTIESYGLADWSGITPLFAELERTRTELVDDTGQVRIDQPAVAAAVDRIASLSRSGALYLFAPGGQIFSADQGKELLLNEQLAMWAPMMAADGGDTLEQKVSVKTAPIPAVDDGSLSSVSGYIMSSGTQHPQASWRWLSYLSAQPVVLQREGTYDAQSAPARKSIAEQLGYWRDRAADGTQAAVEAILNRSLTERNAAAGDVRVNSALGQVLANVIVEGMTSEQAVRAAQTAYDDVTIQLQQTATAAGPIPPIVVATPQPMVGSDVTTIRVATLSIEATKLRTFAEQFNQQNPTIQIELVNPQNTSASTESTLFGQMVATSDIVLWIGPLEEADTLDLQPFLDSDRQGLVADYPVAILNKGKRAGRQYGLPLGMNFRVLAYNQELFAAAGRELPQSQWEFNDFLDTAKALTDRTATPPQFGFVGGGTDTLDFFLDRRDVSLTVEDAGEQRLAFTNPAVVQAVQQYIEFAKTSTSAQQFTGYQRDNLVGDTRQQVTTGAAAMWFDYGLGALFGSPDEATRAIAPPLLAEGRVRDEDVNMLNGYIAASTASPDAAWAVLTAMSTDGLLLKQFFPARTSATQAEAFTEAAPPEAREVYEAYLTALEGQSQTAQDDASTAQELLNLYWFYRAVDRAFLQDQTLTTGLEEAQLTTEQYLACTQAGDDLDECATRVDSTYNGLVR